MHDVWWAKAASSSNVDMAFTYLRASLSISLISDALGIIRKCNNAALANRITTQESGQSQRDRGPPGFRNLRIEIRTKTVENDLGFAIN